MPQPPLSDAVVATLKTDACAALAAILIVANAHSELLAWAQRALSPLIVAPNGAKREESASKNNGGPKESAPSGAPALPANKRAATLKLREAAKLNGGGHSDGDAYRARQRAQRDADDERLIEAMRQAPGASIRALAAAIGKGRSTTVEALHRLRDAGLVESNDGIWALAGPQPASTAPRWIQPLSAAPASA